ncbi:MAG TPA: MarR family transcriptional regulator [Streptosporangiaceae bacterium]|nr:MarR family transcriptional regulator [Streptosporangiaceae bacterium]
MITDDPRLTAAGMLAETFAGLRAKLAPTFAAHGIAPLEFEVLLRLARSPEQRLRMTDLAAQAGMSTSGVTRIVDRLERSGTVRRETCPSDRRSSFAVLTEAGARRLAVILPDHLADIDRWFTSILRPGQLAALLDALQVIRNTVRPGATAGTSGPACAAADVSASADSGDHSAGEVISSG